MDTNQPTTSTTTSAPASAAPGMFGTKIPSLQQVSGFQLATGFKMKNNSSDNSFLNDLKSDKVDEGITKATTTTDKKDPNLYGMIALGLGVLGLLLSFTNAKAAIGGALVTGIASAGALIGMMLDIKKKVKLDMPDTGIGKSGDDALGLDKIGKEVTDKVNITVDFTPWFYIAVIAFLAAAFFCYKRMQSSKT